MSENSHVVLILDDDEAVRESLEYHFEDSDWRVMSASNTQEALEIIEKEPPDGMVVDIRLPGPNGEEFIHKVKEILPQTAFVICTGSPTYHPPEDIAKLSEVSQEVFLKPISNMKDLENALYEQIQMVQK